VDTRALAGWAADHLPHYMVPSALITIDTIPVTINGKTDPQQLPDPWPASPPPAGNSPGPADPAAALAAAWRSVLGEGDYRPGDDFFRMGGDSLTAIRVIGELANRGLHLDLRELYEEPTLAAMAARLRPAHGDGSARPGGPTDRDRPPYTPMSMVAASDLGRLPEGLDDAYPMTAAQQGMLYEIMRQRAELPYHNCLAVLLDGVPAFDEATAIAAAHALTGAHPMLRTSFNVTDFSEPLQLVHARVEPAVEFADWSGEPAPAERIRDYAREQVTVPIRHDRVPLVRFGFFRTSASTGYVTIIHSHAVADGWSVARFVQDLATLLRGEEVPATANLMPELVRLERAAARDKAEAAFWQQALSGSAGLSLLPRQRPGTGRVSVHRFTLDSALRDQLASVAAQAGVPVKSVYLAAHMRIAGLWSDGGTIVSGLVCNGRPEVAEAAQATGLFLNIVPVALAGLPESWTALARAVFAMETALQPHRRAPLPVIRSHLGRDYPLDAWFSYTDFSSLGQHPDTFAADSTEMPLTVNVGSDWLELQANDRYFHHDEAQSLGHAYLATLRSIARAPFADPRRAGWGRPVAGPRQPAQCQPVTGTFLRQAARTPDRAAVLESSGTAVTYRELESQSRHIAAGLTAMGQGRHSVVGISFPRSADVMAAVLGVMRAGAAYLPLDQDLPTARLCHMLDDAKVSLVLAGGDAAALLETAGIGSSGLPEIIAQADPAWADPAISPGDLAYVLYTSGSTGLPKGVSVSHGGLGNLLAEMARLVRCTPADLVSARTSLSFDIATVEFFMPLLCGATVALTSAAERAPLEFGRFINDRGITIAQATPTTWTLLMEAGWRPAAPGIRLISGGEVLPDRLASYLASHAPVFNAYGPTETTVYVSASAPRRGERVTIGRPLANCELAVREPFGAVAPVGVPGELLIGGAGLARGYLNRPEFTAERFINLAIDGQTHRMYRSGDLARQLPDGQFEYLGRLDRQVKLRGFRIEPAEIEAVLTRHPDVHAAVVTLWRSPTYPSDQRLVGYLVPATSQPVDTRALAGWAADHLPHYMVPSALITIDTIPVTINGKTDQQQLAAIFEESRTYLNGDEPARPARGRDELERAILAEYSRLLHMPHVSREDNFFTAGGDSLSAMRLVLCLQRLRLPVTLEQIFDNPTAAGLAAALRGAGPAHRPQAHDPARPGGTGFP
jgi:amino acid adenylation domain-containing protein